MFLGLLWLVWPQVLRGWAVRKASWALFGLLLFPTFFPAVKWAKQYGVDWGSVLLGFLVTCAALQAVMNYLAKQIPLIAFRAAGAASLFSGVWLVWFKK